ncbi:MULTISPECIES: hypothetical protein [unclassified Spirillospora]|uniref:hypothetical protein n=1 Tax=unclassified Spirillospora TaxID=2642701 RepID=UPI0037195493
MDQALRCDRPDTLNVPDHPAIIRPDREAVEAVDDDGLIGARVVRPCAPFVARWAARRGLTPGAVSAIALAAAALAAVWFSAGTRGGLVAGALLLCVSLVLGHAGRGGADGLRAGRAGPSGGRPAAVLGRAEEYAVYAGLAAGAAASGGGLWWAAIGAAALLSVRHTIEASFAASRTRPPRSPLPARRDVLRRARNSLGLPLAERFALISVTAASAGARPAFAVLLAWGSAATAVTLTERSRRSIT